MPLISAKDATVLAYLARHGNASSVRTKELTSELSGSALQVARALTGRRSSRVANRAAKALRNWAAVNESIAEKTPSSSRQRARAAVANKSKLPSKRVAKTASS